MMRQISLFLNLLLCAAYNSCSVNPSTVVYQDFGIAHKSSGFNGAKNDLVAFRLKTAFRNKYVNLIFWR